VQCIHLEFIYDCSRFSRAHVSLFLILFLPVSPSPFCHTSSDPKTPKAPAPAPVFANPPNDLYIQNFLPFFLFQIECRTGLFESFWVLPLQFPTEVEASAPSSLETSSSLPKREVPHFSLEAF